MFNPQVCLYHANCVDGFGAAFAIWLRYGDNNVRYIPVSYGDEPPWPEITGRRVAIVDFSYKRDVMTRIMALAESVLVLDHHKTAEAELKDLSCNTTGGPPGCPVAEVYFDVKCSGAVMTWDYFHGPGPVPTFFKLIQDRDLWTKNFEGVDDFHMALQSYPKDFDTWYRLYAQPIAFLMDEGKTIQRYFRTLVDYHKAMPHLAHFGSFSVPAVNAPAYVASEVAGELAVNHPFAGVYSINQDKAFWSLRSRGDGQDVSEIAKWFGGGGHRNAAGFSIPLGRMIAVPNGFRLMI